MVGQYPGGHGKEYEMTEDMTHNRSVRHIKIEADLLAHGGHI